MTRPLVTVRPAAAADAHTLAALAIQVWLDTYATDGVNDLLGRYVLSTFTPAAFAAWSESPDVALQVAHANGHLVGYALLQFGAAQPLAPGRDTELRTLYVQSPFRRSGVGSLLLREARSAAHARTGSDHCERTEPARLCVLRKARAGRDGADAVRARRGAARQPRDGNAAKLISPAAARCTPPAAPA